MVADAQIRVVVIDPQPLFRVGIEFGCAGDSRLEVVRSVATGGDGLDAVRHDRPDVAVLALPLPDVRGVRILEEAARENLNPAWVVLSDDTDGAAIYGALAAGAAAYLTRDVDALMLCDAIHIAAAGDTLISPKLHRLVASEIRLHSASGGVKLTPREGEVLALVAEGLSSIEIGRTLYVSHTTVKSHLSNLYGKLGVSDRAAAVAQGMKRGLV